MEKLLKNYKTLNDLIDFYNGLWAKRINPYLQVISKDIGHVSIDESVEACIKYIDRLKKIPSGHTGKIRTANTINNYISAIRSVFNYCSRKGIKGLPEINENPFNDIALLKTKCRNRILSQSDVKKLLSKMIKSNSPLLHALKFSIKNPIRFGDLKELKRDNLKYYKDKPFIEMKGRKNPRRIIFTLIDDEMLAYWKSLPADCEYLFPFIKKNGTFTKFSNCKWRYAFTKAKHDSGISDFLWHDIRKMAFLNYKNNRFTELDLRNLGIIS